MADHPDELPDETREQLRRLVQPRRGVAADAGRTLESIQRAWSHHLAATDDSPPPMRKTRRSLGRVHDFATKLLAELDRLERLEPSVAGDVFQPRGENPYSTVCDIAFGAAWYLSNRFRRGQRTDAARDDFDRKVVQILAAGGVPN